MPTVADYYTELQFSFGKIKSRGWRGILLRKQNFLGPDDVLVVESELEVFSEWVTTDNILDISCAKNTLTC